MGWRATGRRVFREGVLPIGEVRRPANASVRKCLRDDGHGNHAEKEYNVKPCVEGAYTACRVPAGRHESNFNQL